MKKIDRKKIIAEVNRRIKNDIEDFNDFPNGKKEQIQDKYIDKVCKEMSWTLSDFYATKAKEFENLLNYINKK